MQHWKKLIGTVGLCLAMLVPLPLNAIEARLPISLPLEETAAPAATTVITGELVYEDLEGGFYSVAGYRLIGQQEEFAANLGKHVAVTGQLANDITIFMTKAINVERLLPVEADKLLEIAGELVYEEIEGGFYAVDGYRLIGETETFEPYLGQQILVIGTISEEESIFMTKAIDVICFSFITAPDGESNNSAPELKSVKATQAKPATVTIDGVTLHFAQDLVAKDGVLMLPLRTIVDAAAGKIAWSSRTRTAKVELPDRVATFKTGIGKVEMRQHGVQYVKQNMITMARAPELIGDRLHISADALSSVFGLLATDASDNVLALVTPSAEQTTPTPEPGGELEWGTISGSIQQITTEGRTRILVEGEAMSNGEPMLIWLTVDGNTKVLWGESQDAASVTDLAVGQAIRVALSGPVLESYPAQGGASLVTILE